RWFAETARVYHRPDLSLRLLRWARGESAEGYPATRLPLGARRAFLSGARHAGLSEALARRDPGPRRAALLLLRVRADADLAVSDSTGRPASGSRPHAPIDGVGRPRAARRRRLADQENADGGRPGRERRSGVGRCAHGPGRRVERHALDHEGVEFGLCGRGPPDLVAEAADLDRADDRLFAVHAQRPA